MTDQEKEKIAEIKAKISDASNLAKMGKTEQVKRNSQKRRAQYSRELEYYMGHMSSTDRREAQKA